MRLEVLGYQSEPDPLDFAEPATGPSKLIWLVVLVAAGLGLAGWKVLDSSRHAWLDDLAVGLVVAEESGKPLFVFYTADWCPPCQQLKRDVLSDPGVDAFLEENFVRVKIDLTDRTGPNAWTASQNGVSGIPTAILYDHRGMETDRVTGGGELARWLWRKSGS